MQEITENNLSINARIMQILDYYGHTKYKFSKKTGVSESVLLNISKGKNKPGYELLYKILNFYEAIDARWLITGIGNMINDTHEAVIVNESKTGYNNHCKLCHEKDEVIKALKEANSALHLAIDQMKGTGTKQEKDYKQTG